MTRKRNKIIISVLITLIMIIGTTQSVKTTQDSSTDKIQEGTIIKEIEGENKKVNSDRR